MIEPPEIEDSNALPTLENKKRYNLHFDEDTERKIRGFCETFSIELNKFIVNTVSCFLYDIEDDIESKAFYLIGGYFDVSKLVDVQSSHNTLETTEKFNEIEVSFPLLISKVIDDLCKEIPLTPEEFIEDTINWSIGNIMDHIKENRYHFLAQYKDFSKIPGSINKIYKNKLI